MGERCQKGGAVNPQGLYLALRAQRADLDAEAGAARLLAPRPTRKSPESRAGTRTHESGRAERLATYLRSIDL
jgi:hypothetical protein